jgi:hypothetical protein
VADRLLVSQQLNANDRLVSPNGKASLVMQTDGNLVLYRNDTGRALWSTNTWNMPTTPTHVILQTDGNFVLYDAAGTAYWASNTEAPSFIVPVLNSVVLQDNGNLVIVGTTSGATLWTTNTFQDWGQDRLSSNPAVARSTLNVNDKLTSPSGRVTLVMQGDGNLVVYRFDGRALWASNTWNTPVNHAVMQGDGNLVCYDAAGKPYWSSNTWNNPGAYAVLGDDGNLVVYDTGNNALWSSSTSAGTPQNPNCQSERAAGAQVETIQNQPFTNWPQNIHFTAPLYFKPRSRSEISNAILQAEAQEHHVRAVGSSWSFSDAVCPSDSTSVPPTVTPLQPGAMIDISQLTASLQVGLVQILAPGVDPTHLTHVEAGITISNLNILLDFQPGRQAIPSGGGRGQTLGGYLATSSHGGDSLVPPLADFVCAMHLVGAGGIEHWIEPSTPITTPAQLQAAYPCLNAQNIHYDTTLFNAALVSAGSMGIVYSVILKTVPQYGLVQHQVASTWEFVAAAGSNLSALIDGSFMASCYNLVNLINGAPLGPVLAPFQGNVFSLVVINPYPLLSNDSTLSGTPLSLYANQHLCIVTNRVPVPIPTTANNPSGPPFDFSQVGHAARNSLGSNVLDYDIRFNNFQNSIQNIPDVSTKAAMLVDFLGQNFDQRTISAAITNVYTQSLPLGDRLDVSYNLSTGVAFGAVIKSLSVEAAFNVTDAMAFIPKVFALVQSYAARQPSIYIGGYLSLRVVGKKTAALLGMQQWTPTCCVEYSVISGSIGIDEFITDLQTLALASGGALHWGQCNEVMTCIDLIRIYGSANVDSFRKARALLSPNDVLATFDTSFTDRLGLSSKEGKECKDSKEGKDGKDKEKEQKEGKDSKEKDGGHRDNIVVPQMPAKAPILAALVAAEPAPLPPTEAALGRSFIRPAERPLVGQQIIDRAEAIQ